MTAGLGMSWRNLVTAVCVAAVLLPAASVLAAEDQQRQDPQRQLDEVQDQLEDTKQGLEEVERERAVTLEDLGVIDAELAELDARLRELEGELASAEHTLGEAEARLAATTSELVATEQELGQTRQQLQKEREVFSERTRASYMHGSPAFAVSLLDARDISEFQRSLIFVERVIEHDRDRVTTVSGLVRQVTAQTHELEALQEREAQERAAAEAERNHVAGLVAAEQELRDQVAGERHKRQLVLNQLDADRETHIQMAAQLEAESAQLEAELRRLAEEEERRRAEEALAASRSSGDGSGEAAPPASAGQLQRPAGGRISSGYGWRTHPIHGVRRFHAGLDFGGGHGAPIYAAEAGTVVSAGSRGGYGNAIVLNHGNGLTTLYAHQSRFAVSSGQQVSRGQVIGYIGSTGLSTGPHLHFEVRVNGQHRDPMGYL